MIQTPHYEIAIGTRSQTSTKVPGQGEAIKSSDRLELLGSDHLRKTGIEKFARRSHRANATSSDRTAMTRAIECRERLREAENSLIELQVLEWCGQILQRRRQS